MKKVRICLFLCIMQTVFFCACGTATTGQELTSTSETTQTPEVIAPVGTEKITEVPTPAEVTEAPQPTEAVTMAPEVTKTTATADSDTEAYGNAQTDSDTEAYGNTETDSNPVSGGFDKKGGYCLRIQQVDGVKYDECICECRERRRPDVTVR